MTDEHAPASGDGEPLMALGHRLRRAREARGLSLPELAGRLRIGLEPLQALESADRERLPETVFVMAQARRVAETLQIDIATELQALRGSGPRHVTGPSRAPLTRRPLSSTASGGRTASNPSGSPQKRTGAATTPIPTWAMRRVKGRPVLAACAIAATLSALWGVWRLGSPAPLREGTPEPAVAAAAPAGASEGKSLSRPSDPAATPQGSAGAPASAGSTAAVAAGAVAEGSIVLESQDASWVEVRSMDGAVLFRGLLRGARLFRFGEGLEVLAGRPDLVSTRIGSAPAQILGPISDVRWRSLPTDRGTPARR